MSSVWLVECWEERLECVTALKERESGVFVFVCVRWLSLPKCVCVCVVCVWCVCGVWVIVCVCVRVWCGTRRAASILKQHYY